MPLATIAVAFVTKETVPAADDEDESDMTVLQLLRTKTAFPAHAYADQWRHFAWSVHYDVASLRTWQRTCLLKASTQIRNNLVRELHIMLRHTQEQAPPANERDAPDAKRYTGRIVTENEVCAYEHSVHTLLDSMLQFVQGVWPQWRVRSCTQHHGACVEFETENSRMRVRLTMLRGPGTALKAVNAPNSLYVQRDVQAGLPNVSHVLTNMGAYSAKFQPRVTGAANPGIPNIHFVHTADEIMHCRHREHVRLGALGLPWSFLPVRDPDAPREFVPPREFVWIASMIAACEPLAPLQPNYQDAVFAYNVDDFRRELSDMLQRDGGALEAGDMSNIETGLRGTMQRKMFFSVVLFALTWVRYCRTRGRQLPSVPCRCSCRSRVQR